MENGTRGPKPQRRGGGFAVVGAMLRIPAVAYLTVCLSLTAWSVLPTLAGWRAAVVTTGSMAPLIRPGDVVLFDKVDPALLKPGNVVLFQDPAQPDRLLTHRVKKVADDGPLTTKGDANQSDDPMPVPPQNVLGRGRLVAPYIGLTALYDSPERNRALTLGGLVLVSFLVIMVTRPAAEDEDSDDAASEAVAGAGPDPDGGPAVPTGRRLLVGLLVAGLVSHATGLDATVDWTTTLRAQWSHALAPTRRTGFRLVYFGQSGYTLRTRPGPARTGAPPRRADAPVPGPAAPPWQSAAPPRTPLVPAATSHAGQPV